MLDLSIVPNIPPNAKDAIDFVIKQEGGWVLTGPEVGDNVAWTYAGVTSNVFNKATGNTFNNVDMKDYIAQNTVAAMSAVYAIYYDLYFLEMDAFLLVRINAKTLLSCCVNIGVAGIGNLLDKFFAKSVATPKDFYRLWLLHYSADCKSNAKKLVYLDGWINRVEDCRALDPNA